MNDNYGKITQFGDNIAGDKHVHYHTEGVQTKKPYTNKDLVIPFTMSKANGAQGGTYVPREDLLARIGERFRTERIVFLSGMGGCGKSELARAYGYRHRDEYEEIFWLTCDDGVVPDLMRLMEKAQLYCRIEKSETRNFSEKVLIIIDNCNSEEPSFLAEMESGTGKALILVTTRLSRMGDYESIIPVESDDPEKFAYEVFEKNYCKKPRWGKAKAIREEEKGPVYDICRTVQYNTMIVSLIAVRLRVYNDIPIIRCAEKIRHGTVGIKGEIKYAKDQQTRSEEIKDILKSLFADILSYQFSDEQKAVLTVLSLTPAAWYEIDFICSLLGEMSNEYAVEVLLDLGWLQGSTDRMAIHPLIAEVIADQPVIIQESAFHAGLLDNYLGMPGKYMGKEQFLINKILRNAPEASPEIRIAVMLIINHGEYKKLFKELYPDVQAAYFLYADHKETRFFEYRDLVKNETCLIAEAQLQGDEEEQAVLLRVYNTGVSYELDLSVPFRETCIKEIPSGICFQDAYLKKCVFNDTTQYIGDNAFFECRGLSGELHLPESITSIGAGAFYGCSGLSGELHLPESITSIGAKAFDGCSGLSGELHLPKSLTSIGDFAFYGCIGLSGELHLPESLTNIRERAFYGCRELSGELHLPESLTSIGASAFCGCSGLSGDLHLPEKLTSIGDWAFSGCSGLSGDLHLPEKLTSIGDWAFSGCSGLSGELHLPENLTSIEESTFDGCSGLSGELRLPESLTNIGERAFSGCSGLSGELHLPKSLTSIGDWAFSRCIGLSGEIHLPETLTSIEEGVFYKCSGLSGELRLPENLTSIGESAFSGCSGLSGELYFPESLTSIGTMTFYGCSGLSGELHLPKSLTSIGARAFDGCIGLSGELHLPESLTNIGKCAFDGCSGLTITKNPSDSLSYSPFYKNDTIDNLLLSERISSRCSGRTGELHLPENLTSIGDWAFYGCSELSGELHLPESITSIGDWAFYGCSGLSGDLHLPENLTSIGKCAFSGCNGLSGALHLPENLTSIGARAFEGCSGLSGELHLPENLTSIGDWAFYGCSELSGELYLPESITSVGDYAFSECSGLSGDLHLPENLTSIGKCAFSGCNGLSGDLHLPENLTSIGARAFDGCIGLNGELHLSDSITSIGDFAFYRCSGLTGALHLPESLTSIGECAFYWCSRLSGEVRLPESLTSIGKCAFGMCKGLEKIVFLNPKIKINGEISPYSPLIICGYRNSTAESYARKHGLVFEELEE